MSEKETAFIFVGVALFLFIFYFSFLFYTLRDGASTGAGPPTLLGLDEKKLVNRPSQ